MPNYIHGYVLYTTGLEAPIWYVQGRMVAVHTVRLGTQNSEFVSVVRSTVDRLRYEGPNWTKLHDHDHAVIIPRA